MKISAFLLKKRMYTHARTPRPLALFVFVCFPRTLSPPSPPQRTYFLDAPLQPSVSLYTGKNAVVTFPNSQTAFPIQYVNNSLIHDSNLTLSRCKYVFAHLNRNSGTSVNCHHAIAGYSRDLLGERYNYFSLRIQNKLVASITASCFTH